MSSTRKQYYLARNFVMLNFTMLFVFLETNCLPCWPQTSQPNKMDQIQRARVPIPGYYIVSLKRELPELSSGDFRRIRNFILKFAENWVERNGGQLVDIYEGVVLGFSIQTSDDSARAIAMDGRVDKVEEVSSSILFPP